MINDEARRYLSDSSIKPVLSVLAFIPGFILILPPFISVYRTAGRIRRMQERAGIQERIHPWIAILLMFVYGLYSLYLQLCLNEIWDRYLVAQGVTPGPLPPPAPPASLPPPPPAP